MNSLKTTIVCVVLLGVLYGMYQVINTPTPSGLEEENLAFEEHPGTPLDPQTLLEEQVGSSLGADATATQPNTSLQLGNPLTPSASTGSPATGIPSPGRTAPRLRSDNQSGGNGSFGSLSEPAGAMQPGQSPNSLPEERPPNLGLTQPDSSEFGGSTVPSQPSASNQFVPSSPSTSLGAEAPANASTSTPAVSLSEGFENANLLISENRFADALFLLSAYYTDPSLSADQRANLLTWLDALAAKVIYSSEHHLFAPYVVQPNDSIERIASRFEVPVELIQKINAERFQSGQLGTGSELKVVPGPFRAVIDIQTSTLTLWLGDMYAGNFTVDLANRSQLPAIGTYRVASRSNMGRDYISASNATIPKMSAANPYGQYSLDLGNGVLIHEVSNDPVARQNGCIGLATNDALDIYSILDRNSEVRLIR